MIALEGFVPRREAASLAEWLCPGYGERFLLLRGLEDGAIAAIADRCPPKTGDPILEAGAMPSAAWWGRYLNEGHHAPDPGQWTEWLDWSVHVDVNALAVRMDTLLSTTKPSRDLTDRTQWTPVEALAWIVERDRQLAEALRPQDWEEVPQSWSHPLKALAWRVARKTGTWREIARKSECRAASELNDAFHELMGALRSKPARLEASIYDGKVWAAAQSHAFAGAVFSPGDAKIDLASGCDVRFDAYEVMRLWPAVRPSTICVDAPESKKKLPPVSDAALGKWIDGLTAREQETSWAKLWKQCSGDFPDKHISRDRFRDMFGDRVGIAKPGRPPNRGKVSAS